jgi:hypothetical protein
MHLSGFPDRLATFLGLASASCLRMAGTLVLLFAFHLGMTFLDHANSRLSSRCAFLGGRERRGRLSYAQVKQTCS